MINITNNEIKFNDLEEKMWKKKMQEDLITGKMKKAIDKELKERAEEPKKIRKVKVGKIKYATKNSILESVTEFRRQKVQQLLRCVKFNEMRLIGD